MEEVTKSKSGSTLKATIQDSRSTLSTDALKDKASSLMEQGQEEAKAYAHEAQQKTKSALADKKEQAIGELGNIAQALRQTGAQLQKQDQKAVAQYTEKAAQQIDRVSGYLSNRDIDQLIEEGEGLARRNPELFLGVTFGLGLLAARFIKSSRQRRSVESGNRQLRDRESHPRPMGA